MKNILYISSRLPGISVTFIDREIRELEKNGYTIKTVSRVRPMHGEVSKDVLEYYKDTLYLEDAGRFKLFSSQLRVLFEKPKEWIANLRLILCEQEIAGLKDRLRLFQHYLEAGYIYTKVKDQGISHIHAHFLNAPTSAALFLSSYMGKPFSFTMHGSNIYIDPIMLKTKIKMCKKAITVSQYNKKYLVEKYDASISDKIQVVHCGIDIKKYTPNPRTIRDRRIVLAVGRTAKVKGFSYLLDACKIMKDEGVEFECLIVGDGEESVRLKEKSFFLGIDDVVTFLGAQPQERVFELLHKASVFVLPVIITEEGSRDGIPVALMEAMALEIPVVSSKIVGIPELIEDRKEGFLVEQKNANELASAISLLIENPTIRADMGRQGRVKVMDEFNVAHIPKSFKCVFES